MRPLEKTYPDYYGMYIPLISEANVTDALHVNRKELKSFLLEIDPSKEEYAYAEGKWTIRQIVNHLCDTERIISYRALRFARKDPQQPLPFEENDYVANTDLQGRDLKDLLHELDTVRMATLSLFESFSDEVLLRKGNTMIGETTVLALGFLIAGHAKHHTNIIRERYLSTEKIIQNVK